MKKLSACFCCVVLLLSLIPGNGCRAGEEALYGPRAPAGSAFVRLFNATASAGVEARLGELVLRADRAYGASAYGFLVPGKKTLRADGHTLTMTLAADRSYTAVLLPDRLALVEDPVFRDRKKAWLVFYNLSGSDHLSVKTGRKKRTVFRQTATMTSAARGVNPVQVELDVYDGEILLARAPQVTLERGRMFSLFVCGDRNAPVVVWVENSVRRGQG
ncbi:alginate O-acetyltransferase AlgF [Thermodesulfobacteriota bacterium B35]